MYKIVFHKKISPTREDIFSYILWYGQLAECRKMFAAHP